MAPSYSPTYSPTSGPTRSPTQDIYDQKFTIDYTIYNASDDTLRSLVYNASILPDIEREVIEWSYFEISKQLADDVDEWLFYPKFQAVITSVEPEGHVPANAKTNVTELNSNCLLVVKLRYHNTTVGVNLKYYSKQKRFQNLAQWQFRKYFGDHGLMLAIGNPHDDEKYPITRELSVGWMATIIVGSVTVTVAILSLIYNNMCKRCTWTDNGNSIAVPLFGLQLVDLFTDVNLCVEIISQFPDSRHHTEREVFLYVAGYGSLLFTVWTFGELQCIIYFLSIIDGALTLSVCPTLSLSQTVDHPVCMQHGAGGQYQEPKGDPEQPVCAELLSNHILVLYRFGGVLWRCLSVTLFRIIPSLCL